MQVQMGPSPIDITKSCLDSISSQLPEHIAGAVLYLDSGCTESFQFVGAFPLFMDLGVKAVCSLENMSPFDAAANWNSTSDAAKKIVVITSRLLSDAHRYILRCLSSHKGVQRCTIFTSISEMSHSVFPDSPLGPDAFQEYGSLLLQDYEELVKKHVTSVFPQDASQESLTVEDDGWSRLTSAEEEVLQHETSSRGNKLYEDVLGQRLVVSVHYFPLILCPISPRVFFLPSEGSIAEASLSAEHEDSLSPGLPPMSTGVALEGDDVPAGAILTAHFLYHLAAKMDLKIEIFSLGDLSKAVGKIMTDMSSLYDVGRRKRSAGLLLIDRTLDLLTPCCHGDSLVDHMFSSLPRRKRAVSSSHMKGSQGQLRHSPSKVHRAPLDVQIPLTEILSEQNSVMNCSQLLKSIESFLLGWDTSNSAPRIADLANICHRDSDEKLFISESQILNGSFVSTETFRGTPYMEAILERKAKDGALLIKKWLQESLRQQNIAVNFKTQNGFATKSDLIAMIKAVAKSQSSLIKNRGIIQLAAAVLVTLEESHCVKWEAFISAEKILSASAGDTSQSLAAQIGDLINKSALVGLTGQESMEMKYSPRLLSFQDALLLMIVGYILAGENFPTAGSGGPFSWQEEHLLKETIVDAILENPSIAKVKFLNDLLEELEANAKRKSTEKTSEAQSDEIDIDDFDDDQWGKWGDEDDAAKNDKEESYGDMQLKLELRDRVDNLFKFLHKLSTLRRRNVPLREGTFSFESSFNGDSESNKGLLYKLLTRLMGKYDVPGLEFHSSTVGRIFKSGFGRFGLGQAKPTIADQNVIMVFVIGGINGTEVREAHEALSEIGRPDVELILGGTTLLTPDNMLDLLMGQSSYL